MAERCDTDKSIMIRVSKVSVAANVFLSAFKLFAGVVGHSGAMIADAVHSLSDVAGSGLVILGAHLSSKESDRGIEVIEKYKNMIRMVSENGTEN